MQTTDLTALIMAGSGMLTALAGIVLSRRGQSETASEARAANALATQKQEHDVYRDLVGDLRVQLDRQQVQFAAAQARDDAERDRLAALLTHSDEQLRLVRDHLAALRGVVLDEVHKASAGTALAEVDDYLLTESATHSRPPRELDR